MKRVFNRVQTRFVVAVTAAVVFVLAVVGTVSVITFAASERDNLDRSLHERARSASIVLARRPPGGPPPPGRLESHARPRPSLPIGNDSFVRLIKNGDVKETNGSIPAGFPLPQAAGYKTVTSHGRQWRTFTLKLRGSGTRQLQIATDLATQNERVRNIELRFTIISLAGILLSIFVAIWLGRITLQPVAALRKAAAGVSTTKDLHVRLPADKGPEEIDALASSINAMLDRLEASAAETESALQTTKQFAADVGHEIRTPLTAIRTNLDLLSDRPEISASERQELLDEIQTEQLQLLSMLESLQALARGDSAPVLPKEQVDIGDLIDSVIEATKRLHPGVEIAFDAPEKAVLLNGWPDGLRMLVQNLLENAARHGKDKIRVALTQSTDGDRISLSVEDNGPGVPAAERQRIFERFTRGDQTRAPGSGLGLALVAQQAAIHGGHVEIDDSELGGARFTVPLANTQ